MRIEQNTIYSNTFDKNIERDFVIYKRDELINFVKNSGFNFGEWNLDIGHPHYYHFFTIGNLLKYDENQEFLMFEEDKIVYLVF